ncbi:hypothetical protein A2U01_0031763 [Trifolium medium]|uniref:Uncharacterized protein n=1 Tax=Trifolium medium TaxID=97028 RepID=A0A392PGQ9_9FABA|nr:hypothetical protein [Trifolium medium]
MRTRLWVESDSRIAIQATKTHLQVPWDLCNRYSLVGYIAFIPTGGLRS